MRVSLEEGSTRKSESAWARHRKIVSRKEGGTLRGGVTQLRHANL